MLTTSYHPTPARSRHCPARCAGALAAVALLATGGPGSAGEPASTSAGERKTAADAPATPPAAEPKLASPAPSPEPARKPNADDDDWNKAGPVNRTPRVSGVLMASYRLTGFAEHRLPDGSRVEDSNTFQLEHSHVKLSGDLSERLSWELMPCLTHMNDFSVVTANFVYTSSPRLQVTVGRFLLPFGQFNLRSLPGSYGTVSRPLLYSSHEDRPVRPDPRVPANFLFTPRDDTGLGLSGSAWLGAGDAVQVSYNLYLTNGLRAVSDQAGRFWDDNNKGKQLGGRLGVSYHGTPLAVSAAASLLANRYEDQHDQRAWAVDAVASYQYAAARRITVRGEYADMTREIQPTALLLQGDEQTKGAYVTVEANLTEAWGVYYQFDTLTARTPTAQLGQGFSDQKVTTNRHAGGLSVILDEYLQLRAEYGLWLLPLGLPDAHRLAVQTVVTF
jgi:hypothetical protein